MTLVDDLAKSAVFALIRFEGADAVTMLTGTREAHERLVDIPLEHGVPHDGGRFDRLVFVPYRQISERGFEAHDDETPLASMVIRDHREIPLEELLPQLPDLVVETLGESAFDIDDDAYAEMVGNVIRDEIGKGEGANLVIGRSYRATLAHWDVRRALSVFRRLLTEERGAYWTFLVFTGERFLIGASPERHISVDSGRVRMNPISGTFRVGSATDTAARRSRFLDFLNDEKEIYELFMVVDEELKMMCDICSEGVRSSART
ncbi:MAG: chorismate-binding protein [Nocardioidaceae bacterium]